MARSAKHKARLETALITCHAGKTKKSTTETAEQQNSEANNPEQENSVDERPRTQCRRAQRK
jgi:hypothetical protein